MRFWFSMVCRGCWLACGFVCLYEAVTQPSMFLLWSGAAAGFYAAERIERMEQVARGEIDCGIASQDGQ